MRFYLAPLEGVTNYIYRNAYHKYFEGLDKYFTPFISTNQQTNFSTRDLKEILPEHNAGLIVVPQILSNKADDFIKTAQAICAYGYNEINLNLGCPSNTVVSKNKGSGFLFHRDELNRFLEHIFTHATMKISIKTRHGKYDHEEFYELVKIFNQYPLEELIIHPRITKDMYKNTPNLEVFGQVLGEIKAPVCYNGDLFTPADYTHITTRFPELNTVMLGRGIIRNPGLVGEIKTGHKPSIQTIKAFHDELYLAYQEVMSGERNVLYKMKELWMFMNTLFDVSDSLAKKIRKCDRLTEYDAIMATIFNA